MWQFVTIDVCIDCIYLYSTATTGAIMALVMVTHDVAGILLMTTATRDDITTIIHVTTNDTYNGTH